MSGFKRRKKHFRWEFMRSLGNVELEVPAGPPGGQVQREVCHAGEA